MKIIPLKYAESTLPENIIFINGDVNKQRKIVFKVYLIKTDERLILVDAGCETMPGFVMKNFLSPIKALEKINIKPEQISDVIITHSHHDHIECVKYFKNAIIHIEKNEYECAESYIPYGFNVNIFENDYVLCENIKILKVGGHSKGSCVVEVENNEKTHVITGDECYLRECIDKKICTGSFYNEENSRKFIEKYSSNKYEILLCHDD